MLQQYRYKLPDNAKINDLLETWDNLNIPLDITGCLHPEESDIYTAPNVLSFTPKFYAQQNVPLLLTQNLLQISV